MLFSPRVALVEGIAEVLVLPAMAAALFPAGSAEHARFIGTVLVPIDGVDFAPYLRVLLTADVGQRIGQRIAVITDADSQNPQRPGTTRIDDLTALIAGLGASNHAALFAAPSTLEPELLAAGNDQAIWRAWAGQQPVAWQDVKAAVEAADPASRAVVFTTRFKNAHLRKGDFAQDFLDAAEDPDTPPIQVPSYLKAPCSGSRRPP